MRTSILALSIFASAGTATAEVNLSIPLKMDPTSSLTTEAYSCEDGSTFSVQYLNSGSNSLAIVPIDGEERIFANVIAASGAKYASGEYVWWTKGDGAFLEKEIGEETIMQCKSEGDR